MSFTFFVKTGDVTRFLSNCLNLLATDVCDLLFSLCKAYHAFYRGFTTLLSLQGCHTTYENIQSVLLGYGH